MARVREVSPEELTPELRDIWHRYVTGYGPFEEQLAVFAHVPAALRHVMPMLMELRAAGTLPRRYLELAIVVVSKLNALRVAQITGDIPQNVNFAVRLEPLRALLERHGVPLEAPPVRASAKDRQSIAEEARAFTTAVICERT
jgi:hypothetical protein